MVLCATGRSPNVSGLGLEEAGVEFCTRKGIHVNKYLQTANKKIYAAGDCCSEKKFTHNSDAQARTVIYNSLLMSSIDINSVAIPWATYTDPEIAHVGKTEEELKESGVKY